MKRGDKVKTSYGDGIVIRVAAGPNNDYDFRYVRVGGKSLLFHVSELVAV